MKNTKQIVFKAVEALTVLTCVMVIGLFIPTFVSLIIVMVSEVSLLECMSTVLYILFSTLGIIISSIYVNEEYRNILND